MRKYLPNQPHEDRGVAMRTRAIEAVRNFVAALREATEPSFGVNPEDQLKVPVTELIHQVADAFGHRVQVRTEVQVEGVGRPDIGVWTGGASALLVGHVELKAPGTQISPNAFRGHSRDQWERFQLLPNLIYTNGTEWRLYRTGEEVRSVVLLPTTYRTKTPRIRDEVVHPLVDLLLDFLSWQPQVPQTAEALAKRLAPLCRLLRDEVVDAVRRGDETLGRVRDEWQRYLFPEASTEEFADAFAQTFTYALLLARTQEMPSTGAEFAAVALRQKHALLGTALQLMNQARDAVSLAIDTLERVVAAIDPRAFSDDGEDPWLYFYETFLAAYDPELRKERGVYYTPPQVVQAQVRLVGELLREKFGKRCSFLEDGVNVLDPAVGTGTYLLGALEEGLADVRRVLGPGSVPGYATRAGQNFYGFELLVGPYAVAHLRLAERIQSYGGIIPDEGCRIFLTDTLENPYPADDPKAGGSIVVDSILVAPLTRERQRAQDVKRNVPILVCIGNPPYDRHAADHERNSSRRGGWIRYGAPNDPDHPDAEHALLQDFIRPVRRVGQGVHLKSLYNDYVYFWRWALWKVFEENQGPGIVSFITASSYLTGPGFAGMREWMRQTLDELYIIDLGGDSRGARTEENVFAIRTPVAIAVGVRYGGPRPSQPANVYYSRIRGTADEKLATLGAIRSFRDLAWQDVPRGWQDRFLPAASSLYSHWPLVTNIFPWQHSGVEPKRTWPVGETPEVLRQRWLALVSSPPSERRELFKESSDRRVDGRYRDELEDGLRCPAIVELDATAACPPIERYAFRSFDRQWILRDVRLISRLRPVLWKVHSSKQIYLTSLLTAPLGSGPAATVCAHVPDRHHFCGRGGKDVIPLWKDAAGTLPNITRGVLDVLSDRYGYEVEPEALFAYVYAVLFSSRYTEQFAEELQAPGPRVPITMDGQLFQEAAYLGKRLIWLHTYGERFGNQFGPLSPGKARHVSGTSREAYPTSYAYDPNTQTLTVDGHAFAPVSPAVWQFSISGFQPLPRWLDRRMKERGGRMSSRLDNIRPAWDAVRTRELLELIWVLEATVNLEAELNGVFHRIINHDTFTEYDLPTPGEDEIFPATDTVDGVQLTVYDQQD